MSIENEIGRIDVRIPGIIENPYWIYLLLQQNEPIVWEEHPEPRWIVTKFDHIHEVLRNPIFVKPGPGALLSRLSAETRNAVQPLEQNLRLDILNQNPPDHTRLRGLISKAFTPLKVEQVRPRIHQIADNLLDRVIDNGQMDFIADFSSQLPGYVIMELLGIPTEDREQIKTWADSIAALFGAARFGTDPTAVALQANENTLAFQQYVRNFMDHPELLNPDSLLATLISVQEEGAKLTAAELVSNVMLLIGAGQETTTHALGNCLLALLQYPDQLKLLRNKPELIRQAIEELLRFNSPVQMLGRVASADTTIGNQIIKKGQFVLLVVGAANRDPSRYSNPDVLDITRPVLPHSSFGFGIHFCLGAALARAEVEIGLQTILSNFSSIELLDTEPVWQEDLDMRALKSLNIAFQ